ncbi:TetR/AcrR family transcriptional regulator [Novosphingobium flavum]|uniref:TetR/AcrR family transcriptional regulator n=1 Tax=Novosphingobium flavum TaxID=1778672 RepID=A0A7X1FS58_9SPHN|nr:TetR/AcrR family transcriptional regulator [Novosphingobium flavum]MBC2665477.1 TetR/AcrR family transcriptional regulator [Novosphingobium flavum]
MTGKTPSKTKAKATTFTVETVSRTPQQGRSKASLERMLGAARALMVERGSEDFTLIEVSKRGNVSIGSIYLRFESKDNLVRAVIAETMEHMERSEDAMLATLEQGCSSLREFVPAFVEAYAGVLTDNAALLRLAMTRAENDPLVAEPGKRAALRAVALVKAALLHYADEFGGTDHETRAEAAYYIIFATLARQLSLGSSRESVTDYDWAELKRELGRMCLAYLTAA